MPENFNLADITTDEGVRIRVRQSTNGTILVDIDTDDVPNDDVVCFNDLTLLNTEEA